MAARKPQFNQHNLYDTTPLPKELQVKEVGASSAPLLSAAYFIGARCRDYNDDYMQCKTENPGRGEFECLKEGRRVTRCARSVVEDINNHCLEQFRAHWNCLENGNQQLWQCRPAEWKLNRCVYNKLKLEKVIPDQPTHVTPVHLRQQSLFAHQYNSNYEMPFIPGQSDEDEKPNQKPKDMIKTIWRRRFEGWREKPTISSEPKAS